MQFNYFILISSTIGYPFIQMGIYLPKKIKR
jgi:hypothetical protein